MLYPLVSIIITTRNEEYNIGNCLESILRNIEPKKYRDLELKKHRNLEKKSKFLNLCL
ncbi:MAG: hypothetical protein ACPLXL_01385 [Minisyncoccia bacterium]